jgi:hypothetical protein
MAVETCAPMLSFLIEADSNPRKAVLTVPILVSVDGICTMTLLAKEPTHCLWRFDLCWIAN